MNDTIIIFCAFSFMYRAQLWADSLGVPYSAQTICKRLLDCYGAEGDTSWKESSLEMKRTTVRKCCVVARKCLSSHCYPHCWNPEETKLWGIGASPV